MFYEVLMEKRAFKKSLKRTAAHAAGALALNPYILGGAVAGGVGGATAAGEDDRLKGALGGAVLGGLAGKGVDLGLARFHTGHAGDMSRGFRDMRKEMREEIGEGLYDDDNLRDIAGASLVGPEFSYHLAKSSPGSALATLAAGGASGIGAGGLIYNRKQRED
jgi:hypothetical protein